MTLYKKLLPTFENQPNPANFEVVMIPNYLTDIFDDFLGNGGVQHGYAIDEKPGYTAFTLDCVALGAILLHINNNVFEEPK